MISSFKVLQKWQKVVLLASLLAFVLHTGVVAYRRTHLVGDFNVNREFGRRFLAGEPLYDGGCCYNYMPISALYWAPLAILPPEIGTVIRAVVSLLCLYSTMRWLSIMIRDRDNSRFQSPFNSGVLAILLSSHYIIRDLDDGGPHLILLAMLVGGVYCAWQGKQLLGAVWLGLAIAVKMTPGLFVPFFVWKRQWRLAAGTAIAAGAWIIAPALWMGPTVWWNSQRQWTEVGLSVFSHGPHPLRLATESQVQNQALQPAILRLLVEYPPGHPLRLDHAWDLPFLSCEFQTAKALATLATLSLLGVYAWWSRLPYRNLSDPAFLLEASGVFVLAVLLSPVTWLQHVVLILPAIYLFVAEQQARKILGKAGWCAAGVFVLLSLALNRELLGRPDYLLLLSLHTHTLCMLIVLGMLMRYRPTAAIVPRASKTDMQSMTEPLALTSAC